MRLVAIVPLYPPASRVGAWLATHEYLRHLVTEGHEVSVIVQLSRSRGWVHDGVTVETMMIGKARCRQRVEAADLVLSHAGDSGFGVNLAKESGKPSVRMAHGANRYIAEGADLLVFNSQALQAATQHECPSIVCHPPVWPDKHRTTRGERITIVNCSEDKGIKTAWRCSERMPDRLFLGVKGGHGFQLEPRTANFTTIPTVVDMREVYSRTRILLMPSRLETWGMVGVEAMCSGIPVIAHPTPGLRESLGDAGIFVDRRDIDGWVREILRLDDPGEYAVASAVALKRVDDLDPTPSLKRFTEALEALL